MKTSLSLLLIVISYFVTAQDSKILEPLDIFDIEFVSDPQVSPDGNQIVYVRNFKDIMTDGNRSNLWIINSDGSSNRPLTSGSNNYYAPRWSPSGDRIAFISNADGKPQLYMRWMDDGTTAKISSLQKSPSSVQWSPDGQHLAFTMSVDAETETFNVLPKKPKGAKWADPPIYIDQMVYRRDGSGYTNRAYRQIFLLPAEGGTPRKLTSGEYNHFGVDWHPDGSKILYSANHHSARDMETRNTEVHVMDIESGESTALTSRYGPDQGAVFSPDGQKIAYTGFDDTHQGYMVNKLYVMDADGSNQMTLCEDLDRQIGNLSWSMNGEGIYFQYDDKGNTYVAQTDLEGERQIIAQDVGGLSLGRPYSGGTYNQSNGTVAFTHSTPDHPAELAVVRDGQSSILTDVNGDIFDHKQLGEVEEIWYSSSHDDRPVQGWIVKPPNFDPDKKYPLLLEIHGGPFANYGSRFSAECQLFAAKGYVVLYTNPRGSSSYGAEFGNLIHHNYPGEDYDDLISGVDAVIDRGYIDEDQLYVTGGSGGGVLTSWIIGKTDRFRAAVVAKPVINWYSFVLYADNLGFFYKYWFPGKPWDHTEHYMNRSPISLVKNVTTPTMLLTGEEDYRTPMAESEQYYAALKLQGVKSALVRIPGASHGIAAKPSNLIAKVNSITKWFEMHKDDIEP